MRTTAAAALRLIVSLLLSRITGSSSSSSSGNVLLPHNHPGVDSRHASPPSPLLELHARKAIEDDGGRQKLRGGGRKRQRRQAPMRHHQRIVLESAGSSSSSSTRGACVTAGCATSGTCNDSIKLGCTVPSELVCEHRWPAYNVCESPPVSSMLPCWMAAVDGSLTLNAISFPGTHDTMAKGSSACLQEGIGDLVYTQVRAYGDCFCHFVRKTKKKLSLNNSVSNLSYSFFKVNNAYHSTTTVVASISACPLK